jgi:hypothetical protein
LLSVQVSGEPNRLARGGGSASGILGTANGLSTAASRFSPDRSVTGAQGWSARFEMALGAFRVRSLPSALSVRR